MYRKKEWEYQVGVVKLLQKMVWVDCIMRIKKRTQDNQLPILAVLGSLPISYFAYSSPTSNIPDWSTISCLLHKYHNPPPTDYFHIFPPIHFTLQPWCLSTTPPVRATLLPSMLFVDCLELYRNIPSIPKAKGGFLYLLSSCAYIRLGL